MNNEEQVNDHIEEDDHTDKIVEDDSINTLIHDTFNVRNDDDHDDHENYDFDDVHNLSLLEKAYKPLYEGSKTNLLFAILFDNELEGYEWSFKHINHTDVKVCNIFHHIHMIVIKAIFYPLIISLLICN